MRFYVIYRARINLTFLIELVHKFALHRPGRKSDALLFKSVAADFRVNYSGVYATSVFRLLKQ